MGFLSKLFGKRSSTPSRPWYYVKRDEFIMNLETIIAEEFSEYELRRNVPASEMTSNSQARDYSFGLYLDGSPKAFIMIMKDKNDYRKKDVVLAKQAAESNGIPYMNFMMHLPNEPEYISNRLKQNVLR